MELENVLISSYSNIFVTITLSFDLIKANITEEKKGNTYSGS